MAEHALADAMNTVQVIYIFFFFLEKKESAAGRDVKIWTWIWKDLLK